MVKIFEQAKGYYGILTTINRAKDIYFRLYNILYRDKMDIHNQII